MYYFGSGVVPRAPLKSAKVLFNYIMIDSAARLMDTINELNGIELQWEIHFVKTNNMIIMILTSETSLGSR